MQLYASITQFIEILVRQTCDDLNAHVPIYFNMQSLLAQLGWFPVLLYVDPMSTTFGPQNLFGYGWLGVRYPIVILWIFHISTYALSFTCRLNGVLFLAGGPDQLWMQSTLQFQFSISLLPWLTIEFE